MVIFEKSFKEKQKFERKNLKKRKKEREIWAEDAQIIENKQLLPQLLFSLEPHPFRKSQDYHHRNRQETIAGMENRNPLTIFARSHLSASGTDGAHHSRLKL